jgi:CCR4-NOT transcription complex subunit 3
MEKFKAREKTGTFSKEGLTAAPKLDLKGREREEAIAWLQSAIEKLQIQLESSGAEIEVLQGSMKREKKTGSTAARVENMETLNVRRNWNMGRLEIILRLISDGSLSTDRVNELREEINFFVECNAVHPYI